MPRTRRSIPQPPITYLITDGTTTAATSSKDCSRLLKLIDAAVAAGVSFIQIREKLLTARMLYELAGRAAALTRNTNTRLLINDRADIAAAAGTDGVHLTTSSLAAAVVRQSLGGDLLIGVSTHSLAEAREAMIGDADFVVFGPVFETAAKQIYGAPAGLDKLKEVATALQPFPVLALGGVTSENLGYCLTAGAAGIAGIGLFSRSSELRDIVRLVQDRSHSRL